MSSSVPASAWFRRRTRELVARGAERYGYQLVHGDHPDPTSVLPGADFDQIPRGRRHPFSTSEYDVAPVDEFDITRKNYYSPIPDLSLLPNDIWTRRSDLCGIGLNADAGIEFIERELAGFIAELNVPNEDPEQPGVFFLKNTGFESVDAELLYGVIRHTQPSRVIELGSGYSTLLINLAAQRNLENGVETRHVAYDPYPREHVLGASLPEPSRLEAVSATELPLEVFEELESGDVLFVDTTHTVKLGSDVNFIVLEILPRLQPGVIIHFHDIFLPWEYPRMWFEKLQYFWAEQYLLQAFLAFNSAFLVLVPAHAVAREHPERLHRVISSFTTGVSPGSLWLTRREAQSGIHDDPSGR